MKTLILTLASTALCFSLAYAQSSEDQADWCSDARGNIYGCEKKSTPNSNNDTLQEKSAQTTPRGDIAFGKSWCYDARGNIFTCEAR